MSAQCRFLVEGYGVKREDKLILLQLANLADRHRVAVANIYELAEQTGYSTEEVVDTLEKHQRVTGVIWLVGNTDYSEGEDAFPIYQFAPEK